MSNSQTDHTILTTTRHLINEWPAFRKILADISCTQRERQEKVPENPEYLLNPLNDTQIYDAFYGPFHPLIQSLTHAWLLISKIRARLTITGDDTLKVHTQDSGFNLPQTIARDMNAAALDKTQQQLSEVAKKYHQKWLELIRQWQESFMMQITMTDIKLAENEINEMQAIEPVSELLDRLTDLQIDTPKMKKQHYHLSDYFTLKVILCIQSALARQHITTDTDQIQQKTLKQLKDNLKKMEDEAKTLTDAANQEIEKLVDF